MKNPFKSPSIEEKMTKMLSSRAHALFEARINAIAHDHYIQRIEAEMAYLKRGIEALNGKIGGNDE